MQVITIPKKLAEKDDLVVIPRKKYEEILNAIKKQEEQDWIYKEPFLSELKKE